MSRVRHPLTIAVLLGLLGLGLFLAISRGWIRLPFADAGGPPFDGRCAVRANGDVVGTIIEERSDSVTGQIRYRIRSPGSNDLTEVSVDEVGVVPCEP